MQQFLQTEWLQSKYNSAAQLDPANFYEMAFSKSIMLKNKNLRLK